MPNITVSSDVDSLMQAATYAAFKALLAITGADIGSGDIARARINAALAANAAPIVVTTLDASGIITVLGVSTYIDSYNQASNGQFRCGFIEGDPNWTFGRNNSDGFFTLQSNLEEVLSSNPSVAGNLTVYPNFVANSTLTVAGISTFGAQVRLKGYTVATLPTGTQGDTAFVTDALAPTFLVAVVGGGSVVTTVFHNGTTWVSQ